MEFALIRDEYRRECRLTATPGEYDGWPPLREARVAANPVTVHADRAAVASALVFGSYLSGVFSIEPGCSPLTAGALRDWFAPVDVHVAPVELAPSRIETGPVALRVAADGIADDRRASTGAEDRYLFRLVPEGAGAVATMREMTVVSNATLVPPPSASRFDRLLAAVGIAVLFSEDLFAGSIEIPRLRTAAPAVDRLRRLLDAVGLNLRVLADPAPKRPRQRATPTETGDLVHADPQKINLVFKERPDVSKAELQGGTSVVLDGDWDTPADKRFEEIDNFVSIRARMIEGRPWETTPLWARVVSEINAGRTKWGCRTEDEFRERCLGLERLFERIRDDGFKSQEELDTGRPDDEIRVAVVRDGRLMFVDGRHRLTVARLLGLESVPVRIVARHAEWQRFKDKILRYADSHNGKIYQRLDHPDLAAIPAQHTTDRLHLLQSALADYDGHGRKLVDLGTHWGYMAHQFGKLGFQCTGVERSPANRRMAEAMAVATESDYTVWGGDLLEFPAIEEQDVVLALNIFHHLIKTEQDHDRLIAFLGRMRADRILFEPHRHDPPGQMVGAYRNYAPDEFAAFVAEHAGLRSVKRLGEANDGRTLFVIS